VPDNWVYVQADSNDASTRYGTVYELDEAPNSGLTYNNIAALKLSKAGAQLSVVGSGAPAIQPGSVVTAGNYLVFLPAVFRNFDPSKVPPPTYMPNLWLERITVLTDTVQVRIQNTGNLSVTDDFWVDLYINPQPAPTGVNQPWPEKSEQGAVWGVTSPAVPIAPGGVVTLTINDAHYWPEESKLAPGLWAALLRGDPPPPLSSMAMLSPGTAHAPPTRQPNQLPPRR